MEIMISMNWDEENGIDWDNCQHCNNGDHSFCMGKKECKCGCKHCN